MSASPRSCEKWIWTELIGFDNTQPDHGVEEYLQNAGFVPEALCLLLTSPDFILSYAPGPDEAVLPPDFCARDGHEFNRHRQRQEWTKGQVRALIAGLQQRGVAVYLTVFTSFYGNRFHPEWLGEHQEVWKVFRGRGRAGAMNVLARLNDGGYFEDYFLRQLVAVLADYGFDGWHGADGFGPLSGPLYETCVGDDMVAQFQETGAVALPAEVTAASDEDPEALDRRARWLWQHARAEWIEFWAQRWANFWTKACTALHATGKLGVINSAWGRAPFESLYRYGVDYRRIVDTGVDGIVVETAAAGLALDPRCGDEGRHFDFLSMFMLIRAYVPEAKLIFLHNAHDVVEQWDAIRHSPTLLEKEIYSLANVYRTRADGAYQPAADGLLVCLGDAIAANEWGWLRRRWELAFGELPQRTIGATLVWSDAALHQGITDFINHRNWFSERLVFHLMTHGAPVQSTVRVEDLSPAAGPLLLLNPHLWSTAELDKVLQSPNRPLVVMGHGPDTLPAADFTLTEVCGPQPCFLKIYGVPEGFSPDLPSPAEAEETELGDFSDLLDPPGYWDYLPTQPVSTPFLQVAAQLILELCARIKVTEAADRVALMVHETRPGVWQVGVKSKSMVYTSPRIDLGRPIREVVVLTDFPSVVIKPQGSTFTVKLPPWGIVVLEVTLETES